MSTKTPSKHLSLVKLEEIATNNYTSKTKDFDAEEVNRLIWEKMSKLDARKVASVTAEFKRMDIELPPPIPAEADEGLEDIIIPHGETRRHTPISFEVGTWRIIRAKFASRCKERGTFIDEGDRILWHKEGKAVYSEQSEKFEDYLQFTGLPF
jgi:hypothetical protein